ncbi:MAG TPA: hypothetical protein VF908_06170 [Gemmatimonadaceae bacterium]
MYSTCLFCHTELGANEAVEHFRVGRRLAFDAAKGRLWVVCRKCERWNLTPVEERWEAIEECERSYRETRLRVSTDHIGLARLAEGLELVRIGKPQRPEFAAWRYGDQFGRRRRKSIMQGAAIIAGVATIPFLGPALGISFGGFGGLIFQSANLSQSFYRSRRIVARVHDSDRNLLVVRGLDAGQTVMLEPTDRDPWGLRIKHRPSSDRAVPWWRYGKDQAETDIRGEDAVRAAAQLLPRLNANGASSQQIKKAVALATEHEDASVAFERAARLAVKTRSWNNFGRGAMLSLVAPELRLALEMVSHEESERRALEGELAVLEEAWREAEEIAAISDDMFLPEDISKRLTEMKGR